MAAASGAVPSTRHGEGGKPFRYHRAMHRGAAGPATSTVTIPVVATSVSCRATMYGAAHAFGRARAIGATKNVSFKKIESVRFKISFEKVLKLKKIQDAQEGG